MCKLVRVLFSIDKNKKNKKTNIHLPGGPSIIILIHRICIAFNGFGIPINVDNAINDSAAIDVLN